MGDTPTTGARPTARPAMTEARAIAWDSIEGQNLRAATAFLRSMGESEAADKLDRWMKDGWVHVDPKEEDNADTSRLTGRISLGRRKSQTLANDGRLLNPDQPDDFARIVGLARTLYHERFHSENDATFGRIGPAMSRDVVKGLWELTFGSISTLVSGGTVFTRERLKVHEVEPWTSTLLKMNEWMNRYAAVASSREPAESVRRLARARQFAIAAELKDALESFLNSDCFGENPKPWKIMLSSCEEMLALRDRQREAERPPGPPGEELQRLFSSKDRTKFEELARRSPDSFRTWLREQESADVAERESARGAETSDERRRQERLLDERISKRNAFIAGLASLR